MIPFLPMSPDKMANPHLRNTTDYTLVQDPIHKIMTYFWIIGGGHAWPISETYSGDGILRVHAKEGIIKKLQRNGRLLWDALTSTRQVSLYGYYPHFQIRLLHHDQRIGMSYFMQECASQGILPHPQAVSVLNKMRYMDDDHLSIALRSEPYEDAVRR